MESLEEPLLEALAEERRLSEERALLPAFLCHDLANVLGGVTLASQLILSGRLSAASHAERLAEIHGGVRRMRELVEGARELYVDRRVPRDFARRDLVAFVRGLVEERGVWPAGAPVALELPARAALVFSPTLLRHVLVNLVGNAIAYSADTWVRVRLARVRGGRWQISVANGGPGIPRDHLPFLFTPDVRLKRDGRVDRSGVGLYVARSCARSHGATLRVRTRPGLTVFGFHLEADGPPAALERA
ncbi:MAG: hypothetical protein RLZZ15_306 [Verrucomicrobiota bacterium]|jgi:signal transduction histidine kinase